MSKRDKNLTGIATIRFGAAHNEIVVEPGTSKETTIDLNGLPKPRLRKLSRMMGKVYEKVAAQ